MEEGLCGDEEGGGAHPQQHNELQEPEAEGQTKRQFYQKAGNKQVCHFLDSGGTRLLNLDNSSSKSF